MPPTDLVPVPSGINTLPDGSRVANAKQATMLALLGNPRADYGTDCREITNPRLKPLVESRQLGPIKVRGLRPAVDGLERILAEIQAKAPEIHPLIGTAGMLCCRFVRGSTTAISNHSWGTAIDLTLDGKLDPRGDDRVQVGLIGIAPIFNRHGWYWGAGFGTEDAMHFEAGDGLIRAWAADGLLGAAAAKPPPAQLLSLGDRGPQVAELQRALNAAGGGLLADGIFGRDTQAALMAFQGRKGMTVDGVAGREVMAALQLMPEPANDEAAARARKPKARAA